MEKNVIPFVDAEHESFFMRISEGAGLKTVTIKRWFTVLGFLKIHEEMSTGSLISR